jgi:hypothetical protein
VYSLLASVLKDSGQSAPRPGHYIPGMETRYPSYRKLEGALGPVSCVREILPPPSFEPGTVQSVASQCTSYTISALGKIRRLKEKAPPLPVLTVSRWHACVLPSFPLSAFFFPRAVYSATLKTGAARSSETPPYLYQITGSCISLDSSNHSHRCEDRMSQLVCRDCQHVTDGLVKLQK